MKRRCLVGSLTLALASMAAGPTGSNAQVDQGVLREHILGADVSHRDRALAFVGEIDPEAVSPALRAALNSLLRREGDRATARHASDRNGVPLEELEDPLLIGKEGEDGLNEQTGGVEDHADAVVMALDWHQQAIRTETFRMVQR